MKKQIVFGVLVLGLAIGLVAVAPAHAQDSGSKIQLFAGYSYGTNNFLGSDECDGECGLGSVGLHGYALSAAYKLHRNIALEAAFTGHNGTNTIDAEGADGERVSEDIYTYTFGPKFMLPVGNFTLFSHALVGGTHVHAVDFCVPTDEECGGHVAGSGFAFKTGGGIDWNHGRWGVRILEVDYLHSTVGANFDNGESFAQLGASSFELSTGLTFNFGK